VRTRRFWNDLHRERSQSAEKTLTINLDRNDITEILLKVALNTIQQTNKTNILIGFWNYSSS
jgi:hypothetical protein